MEPYQKTSRPWERQQVRTLTNQTVIQGGPCLPQESMPDGLTINDALDDPTFGQCIGLADYNDEGLLLGAASDITSFQTIETLGGAITENSGSFFTEHHRQISNVSIDPFAYSGTESSDEPYFSTPSRESGLSGEGSWVTQGELVANVEQMSKDGAMYMPHNADAYLGNMCSPEPKQIFNPYRHAAFISSSASPLHQGAPHSQLILLNNSEPPWNPIGNPFRVPSFPPGYPAFAPSPGPVAEQNSEDILNGVPSQSQCRHVCMSLPSEDVPNAILGSKKGKEKAAETGWEHTVIRKDGLLRISDMTIEQAHQVHTRKLTREQRARAARIRKIKACWPCWLSKVPCSEGEICKRCLAHMAQISTPAANHFCSREGFRDFGDAFFPEYFHSHFGEREITSLINEHARCWTDQTLTVDISIDPQFLPIEVLVNVFVPRGDELRNQYHLTTEAEERSSQLRRRCSAPVGLLCLYLPDLKQACREYIEAMIDNPLYATKATLEDTTTIPFQLLQIIRKYFLTKPTAQLVRNAYMLHAIHYFMSRLVTFSESSAASLYQATSLPTPKFQPYLSSRLLNRQIKYAMHHLHRELTASVLEGLEKSLRKRTPDFWGPSLAAMLVLCLCCEGLQTAADTFVVCDWERCRLEGMRSELRRCMSESACKAIEEWPWEMCTTLFHEVYKSRNRKEAGGFNPLRDDETRGELDGVTEEMVKDLVSVIRGQWLELVLLSQRPALVDLEWLVDVRDIRVNNTGRLAAKFLLSFY